ncbi:DNA-binding protein [Pseudomonas sp. dw_358]|uniref:DNA-binding protein n=1 Tax=Pseudomonas sp. dw_358 TaxID=2720083 RepID=UPI001BD51C93
MTLNSGPIGLPKTRDLVRHYAAQLLEAGAEVSVSAIRTLIRDEHGVTASPNVVGDEVKQFWARTGPLLSARLKRPGIPEAVCQVLDSVWEVALNEATAAYAIERSHHVQEADRAKARAAVALEEAEQARGRFADQERQIALLGEHVQRLSAQLDRAQAQNEEIRGELREVMNQHQQQGQRHATELERLQTSHQAEQMRFAQTHAAEVARLQAVHQEENSALRAEVSRQADIFESTTNHLMMETSRVRDAAKLETERLTQELTHSRDLVDQLRVQRSDAKEESAGLRVQVESAAMQLRQLQKAHDWLEAQEAPAKDQKEEGRA